MLLQSYGEDGSSLQKKLGHFLFAEIIFNLRKVSEATNFCPKPCSAT